MHCPFTPCAFASRAILVLIAFSCGVFTESTRSATFTVSDGDVDGLKNAIITANSNGEDDIIQLAENGSYVLTAIDNSQNGQNGLPVIGPDGGRSLSITGRGAVVRRTSAAKFRILCIGEDANVTISGLTVSNGYVDGTLVITGGGGGILNYRGNLGLKRCTLTGNFAIQGGGLFNYGATGTTTSLVSESTIYQNTANYYGGGIYNFGSVNTGLTNLIVTNSTICNNFASYYGGGFVENGFNGNAPLTIASCTLSGNNAGSGNDIWHYTGSLRIGHTILADVDALASGGGVVSDGYNLSYGDSNGWLNSATDSHSTDLKLDPAGLQDNGGATKTIALLPESPAVDGGNIAIASARDQRGYFRNGRNDIGAFEYNGGLIGSTSITQNGNDIVVSAEVVSGKMYRLERKLDITDPDWHSISGVNDFIASDNDIESVPDPNAIALDKAFYRIRFLSP